MTKSIKTFITFILFTFAAGALAQSVHPATDGSLGMQWVPGMNNGFTESTGKADPRNPAIMMGYVSNNHSNTITLEIFNQDNFVINGWEVNGGACEVLHYPIPPLRPEYGDDLQLITEPCEITSIKVYTNKGTISY